MPWIRTLGEIRRAYCKARCVDRSHQIHRHILCEIERTGRFPSPTENGVHFDRKPVENFGLDGRHPKIKILGDHRCAVEPGCGHPYRNKRDFLFLEKPKEL